MKKQLSKKPKKKVAKKKPTPKYHKVFVYGTLLAGEANQFFANIHTRQSATAVGALYDTGHGFPAFSPMGENTVYGELVKVNSENFAALDRLEGYPLLYTRIETQITLASGRTTKAWVYVMNKLPPYAKKIPGGDWRKDQSLSKAIISLFNN